MNKKGITVIHKHFVVQHHLGLLPHPWGRLHASATTLLTALGPLCTQTTEHIFDKFANSKQLVLCDNLERMSPCLHWCGAWNPWRRLFYKPPGPPLSVMLPSMVQIPTAV